MLPHYSIKEKKKEKGKSPVKISKFSIHYIQFVLFFSATTLSLSNTTNQLHDVSQKMCEKLLKSDTLAIFFWFIFLMKGPTGLHPCKYNNVIFTLCWFDLELKLLRFFQMYCVPAANYATCWMRSEEERDG